MKNLVERNGGAVYDSEAATLAELEQFVRKNWPDAKPEDIRVVPTQCCPGSHDCHVLQITVIRPTMIM